MAGPHVHTRCFVTPRGLDGYVSQGVGDSCYCSAGQITGIAQQGSLGAPILRAFCVAWDGSRVESEAWWIGSRLAVRSLYLVVRGTTAKLGLGGDKRLTTSGESGLWQGVAHIDSDPCNHPATTPATSDTPLVVLIHFLSPTATRLESRGGAFHLSQDSADSFPSFPLTHCHKDGMSLPVVEDLSDSRRNSDSALPRGLV